MKVRYEDKTFCRTDGCLLPRRSSSPLLIRVAVARVAQAAVMEISVVVAMEADKTASGVVATVMTVRVVTAGP